MYWDFFFFFVKFLEAIPFDRIISVLFLSALTLSDASRTQELVILLIFKIIERIWSVLIYLSFALSYHGS